jgi:hypothetical protein
VKTCEQCGKNNDSHQNFCVVCGNGLPPDLASFLADAGLAFHEASFRNNDLNTIADLLSLVDSDLKELQIPYGDIVRLRNALSQYRKPLQETQQISAVEPQQVAQTSSVVSSQRAAESTHSASTTEVSKPPSNFKVVAVILFVVSVLVVLGIINNSSSRKSDSQTASPPNLPEQHDHEQELAEMRERAHLAEKEKAEAEHAAAEKETEALREAARIAEEEKSQALERAAEAERQASQRTAQQQEEASAQSEQSPQLNGLDEFFRSYINSLASNNQWDVASHYADSVQYGYAKSKSGIASRNEIAEDIRKLIYSYPERSYSNISIKEVLPSGPTSVRINYTFDYQYNGKKLAMGSTNVWANVQLIEGEWKITSWQEKVQRIR